MRVIRDRAELFLQFARVKLIQDDHTDNIDKTVGMSVIFSESVTDKRQRQKIMPTKEYV